MTRKFFQKYGRTIQEKLRTLGAFIKVTSDNPEAIFLDNGYKRIGWSSMAEKSMEFESRKVPKFLLKTLLRTLATGYAIYVFESGA
jgi:hypothetical protein